MVAFWKMFWLNYCKQDLLVCRFFLLLAMIVVSAYVGNFRKSSSDIVSCVGFGCKFLFKHVKNKCRFCIFHRVSVG